MSVLIYSRRGDLTKSIQLSEGIFQSIITIAKLLLLIYVIQFNQEFNKLIDFNQVFYVKIWYNFIISAVEWGVQLFCLVICNTLKYRLGVLINDGMYEMYFSIRIC